MAGIDWEGLLGVEGDELQDAYDEAVEAWDEPYVLERSREELEEMEKIRVQRRLSLYQDENPAERKAVREALEARFHTKFNWIILGACPPGTKACLWDDEVKRIVLTDAMGRIVLLSENNSQIFYEHDDGYDFDWDCISDGWDESLFREPHVSDLKHEYDADGMPFRVYGTYYKVYDDYYYEEINNDNYTVWYRPRYQDEALTWVFERVQGEGGLILKPVEIWNSNYRGKPRLIWKEKL